MPPFSSDSFKSYNSFAIFFLACFYINYLGIMTENYPNVLALLHKIAKEQNLQGYDIKVKPISSGGANYTSILFVAVITSKNKEDLNLFIKVAAMGEQFRSSTSINIYEYERFIYTELKRKFRKLEGKHGVPEKDRLRMPEYYGASSIVMEEMLVLENLSSRGFVCPDRIKSVDWKFAAAAITELAKLHALSMALEHENPDAFTKIKQMFQLDVTKVEGMNLYWESTKLPALKAVREENLEKLKRFLDAIDITSFFDLHLPLKREVLVHGDFAPSNTMHCHHDDGSIEVIPVDYQTLRSGCPVMDLLYFIFTGTDGQFRAQYYQKLLDHYYAELSAALTRLGLDPDVKYSRDDFEYELREKLPLGLVAAVFTLPIVTVEVENAPKVDENMGFADLSVQNTSSLFLERLNEVVDDFVRWGVL